MAGTDRIGRSQASTQKSIGTKDFFGRVVLVPSGKEHRSDAGGNPPLAGAATSSVQVGLRGVNNTDYNNLMTDATHLWNAPLTGTSNSSSFRLSSRSVA